MFPDLETSVFIKTIDSDKETMEWGANWAGLVDMQLHLL